MRLPLTPVVVWLSLATVLPMVPRLRPFAAAPAVVGMPASQARRLCADHGLQLSIAGRRWERNLPADCVLEQFPVTGRQLLRGTSVDVLVNVPPSRKDLPDLYGKPAEHAWHVIRACGYVARFSATASERVPAGRVIVADSSDGSVSCLVSTGPPRRTVPDVTGMPLARARSTVASLNLDVRVDRDTTSSQPPGTIVRQQPVAGSRLPSGGEIVVTVSAGEPPALPQMVGLPLWQACLQAQNAGLVTTVDNSNAPGPRFVVTQQRRDDASPTLVHLQVEAPP